VELSIDLTEHMELKENLPHLLGGMEQEYLPPAPEP